MDDNELVKGVLDRLVRPRFHDHYHNDLLESLQRTDDPMKKNELIRIFIEEIGLLFPKTLLRYKPGEDPQSTRNTPRIGYRRPCTKCPKQKHHIGDKIEVQL